MQLSKHFKLEEFTKSMTAIRKGIDNTPGSGDIKNLEDLCYCVLEQVRNHFKASKNKIFTLVNSFKTDFDQRYEFDKINKRRNLKWVHNYHNTRLDIS